MALLQRGIVKGVKTIEKVNRNTGEVTTRTLIGFEEPKPGGYQGETVVRDIQVTKAQLKEGLPAAYEKLIGQEVQSEVFVSAWTNGRGMSFYFAGEGKPCGLK